MKRPRRQASASTPPSSLVGRVEAWAWVLILLASTAPAQALLDGGGRPGTVLLSGLAAAAALTLAALRGRWMVAPVLRTAWPVLTGVALMGVLSLAGVDERWSTVRWLTWLPCVVTSFAAACSLPPSRFVAVVLATLASAVGLSLGVALIHPLPLSNPAAVADGWSGLYPTKNILGPVAGLAFALTLICGRKASIGRVAQGLALAAALACLIGARSLSGWSIAAALTMLGWSATRARGWPRRVAVSAVMMAIIAVVTTADRWASLTGKGEGLNGRAAIWTSVWEVAMRRPLAGAGFNYSGSADMAARLKESFGVYSVHSAYLDALLCLGAPLCVFMAGAIFFAAWQAWRAPPARDGLRTFAAMLGAGCLLSAITESAVTAPSGPLQLLALLSLFGLCRAAATRPAERAWRRRASGPSTAVRRA